jgi:hypothetical protein
MIQATSKSLRPTASRITSPQRVRRLDPVVRPPRECTCGGAAGSELALPYDPAQE